MQNDQLLASESSLPQLNVTQQTTTDQWASEQSQPQPIAQETGTVPIGPCVNHPNTQQTVSATIEPNINHVVTPQIASHAITTQQTTSTSQRSLPTDSASAVRYHVVNNARDSDCESGIVHSYVQLNVSGAASNRSTGNVSTANVRRTAEERRRQQVKYRRRRNRIGLLLVFATLLLFAGLVVCANTREYFAGATISVIGVLLGSSSMVLCLVTTDSCERVHDFRERVYSYHRRRGSSFAGVNANDRSGRTRPRRGDAAVTSISAANSSLNVHDTMIVHPALPPTAVCSLSGDFLDHLPPPTYETAEILMREDLARDQGFAGDMSGAVGGTSDYQYYKVSQAGSSAATPATSTTNLAATSAASPSCGHLCEDCVQRQQSTLDASGGSAATPESEHLLIAPAIVVELPTYDEAIAEDTCRDGEDHGEPDS